MTTTTPAPASAELLERSTVMRRANGRADTAELFPNGHADLQGNFSARELDEIAKTLREMREMRKAQ